MRAATDGRSDSGKKPFAVKGGKRRLFVRMEAVSSECANAFQAYDAMHVCKARRFPVHVSSPQGGSNNPVGAGPSCAAGRPRATLRLPSPL